jgi:hypothetical protein
MGRMSGAASNGEAHEPPASAPSPPDAEDSPHPNPLPEGEGVTPATAVGASAAALRSTAARIAIAAHRLNTLRKAWPNPPEWTERVPDDEILERRLAPNLERSALRRKNPEYRRAQCLNGAFTPAP